MDIYKTRIPPSMFLFLPLSEFQALALVLTRLLTFSYVYKYTFLPLLLSYPTLVKANVLVQHMLRCLPLVQDVYTYKCRKVKSHVDAFTQHVYISILDLSMMSSLWLSLISNAYIPYMNIFLPSPTASGYPDVELPPHPRRMA